MGFQYSFWEKDSFLKDCDYLVVGGGLVGINSAISLKEARPEADVLVLDRGVLPLGASTRNAGFACFGSVTELLDDLEKMDEDDVLGLLRRRIEGLNFLRRRVGDANLDYANVGGYEVFDQGDDVRLKYTDFIEDVNAKITSLTGRQDTFKIVSRDFGFHGFNKTSIFNQYEGSIHPGKMMQELCQIALKKGVRLVQGLEAKEILDHGDHVEVVLGQGKILARKLVVCTNGFTGDLFPELLLRPARNQVLVTEEISGLRMNSCFHYDKGYTYFRNIGQRVLIGGGRNLDLENESTTEFGQTEKIDNYLVQSLVQKIGLPANTRIEHRWSGIMGVGDEKLPILKKKGDNIIFALRLGGMGVALGSKLGHDAAKILLRDTT